LKVVSGLDNDRGLGKWNKFKVLFNKLA
jgi:hypothetical protein